MKNYKHLLSVIICVFSICLLVGCAGNRATGNDPNSEGTEIKQKQEEVIDEGPKIVKLYLDFAIESDESFLNHSISVLIDEEEIDTIDSDFYYTKLLDITAGKHTVGFCIDGVLNGESIKEVIADEDICLSGNLLFQNEIFSVVDLNLINSIADSAIAYEDMGGVPLADALSRLNSMHFVNVRYKANSESDNIVDVNDWEVETQNIIVGTAIDKAEMIELTCKKVYHQFYLDLTFDSNILLAKYGLILKLDGETLDTIPHGSSYTKLLRLHDGDHTITFYKETDNSISASKYVTTTGDSTLKARLHTNNKSIEINNSEVLDSIVGASLEVPNVVGMTLSSAFSKMSEAGLSNLREEPYANIWNKDNWTVTEQDVTAGTFVDKNTRITLQCVKTVEYLTNNYLGLKVSEAEIRSSQNNNTIRFIDWINKSDFSSEIAKMSQEEKNSWVVKQASSENGVLVLAVVYCGYVEMPNLVGRTLSEAYRTMNGLRFSSLGADAVDGSFIWDESEWIVKSQSVEAGLEVNADGYITFTVEKPAAQSTTSSSTGTSSASTSSTSTSSSATSTEQQNNSSVYYSTNDKDTVKKGNSGVYAYKSRGGTYDNYYIIDFDEGWVYFFADGNESTYGDKTKITSGDLNSVLIAYYYDYDSTWAYGFHFKWKNQPDHLILQDQNGFEYDFYATSLEDALAIKAERTFSDLSKK